MTFFFYFFLLFFNFCPLDSKNVFVFVLAHLEPELELFEVDDIGNDGDDDLSHHYIPNFKQLSFFKETASDCVQLQIPTNWKLLMQDMI